MLSASQLQNIINSAHQANKTMIKTGGFSQAKASGNNERYN